MKKKVGIYNAVLNSPSETIPAVSPIVSTNLSADYWPMGIDNLFPQALNNLLMRTPSLSAGIESKKDYTLGKGLFSDDIKTQNWLLETKFNRQLERIIFDKWFSGNAYIGISWNKKTFRLYHWDTTMARIGRNKFEDTILFFPDWTKYSKWGGESQKYIKTIPIWPNYTNIDGDNHSVIHLSDYQPTYQIYGVPKYISALKSAQINYKSDQWNVSKIDNQFQPGSILSVPVSSQEEADKVQSALQEKKGSLNNGELLLLAKGMGGEHVDLEILRSENEGEWLNVRHLGKEEIVTALNWFSILLGQATAGKLGQTQEIRNTYILAMNTVIEPEQSSYIETITEIINHFGLSGELKFKNITPFDYSDRIDINRILTIREGLGLMGFPIDETRKDLENIIANGTNNSAASKG